MATITANIGTRLAENVDITGTAGANPYTVTLAGATSNTVVGDKLEDEHAAPRAYLITAVNGAELTVLDQWAVGSAPDSSGTTQAVTKRAFSTIILWEAVLNGASGGAGNDAVGECYDDSEFDEAVVINDAAPDSITLTVAELHRHDGTAGIGARIVRTGNGIVITVNVSATVEWLEIDASSVTYCNAFVQTSTVSGTHNVCRMLMHEGSRDTDIAGVSGLYGTLNLLNCIVYDVEDRGSGGTAVGVRGGYGSDGPANIFNTTVHNVYHSHASNTGNPINVRVNDDATKNVRNVHSTDPSTAGSGTPACYSPASPSNATMDYNIASDDSDSGVNSLGANDGINTSDEFVGHARGFEDLHLKAGADAIGAGTDLGTTPTGVNIDIDGTDRNLGTYDPWDIGAHEYAVGEAPPAFGGRNVVLGGGVL